MYFQNFLVDLKTFSVFISSALLWYKVSLTADSSDALQALQHKQQICVHIYPTCLFKRINHNPSGERATWCISRPRREPQDGRTDGNRVSAVRTETLPQNPPHPFLEIFSGRNCAVLKQIYFNTRHNIWTNKKKKKEHFYILLSRSKKKKEKRTFGFSIVCRFCILTSSLRRSMFYFAARRRRHV